MKKHSEKCICVSCHPELGNEQLIKKIHEKVQAKGGEKFLMIEKIAIALMLEDKHNVPHFS